MHVGISSCSFVGVLAMEVKQSWTSGRFSSTQSLCCALKRTAEVVISELTWDTADWN